MKCRSRCVLGMVAAVALLTSVCCWSVASAQSVTLFAENFNGLDLGTNVEEGVAAADPRDAVFSPDGPPGWTVDRSEVPGYGTATDGVTEFAGWTFLDPLWWEELAAGQQRDYFAFDPAVGGVIAVADSDEWADAARPAGMYNTFMSTPAIPVAGLPANTPLNFLSSWRAEGEQTATVTVSFDGGAPIEIMRYESNVESEYYWPDANPEDVSIPLNIPAGTKAVVVTFGLTEADNNWWWAVDNIEVGNYFEDFEGVALGPNVDRGAPVLKDNVWTPDLPTGWSRENDIPGQDEGPENDGVREWLGWNVADKGFWISTDGQRREEFAKGSGAIVVADSDEWDDAAHPDGIYNTFLTTPSISLAGVDPNTAQLQFDSSWRPESNQTATIFVSYDGGSEIEVLRWESVDGSEYYKNDESTNDTILVDLGNPQGASSMVLTFGYTEADNNWFWAIDNIQVLGKGNVGVAGDYNKNGTLDAADLDLQAVAMVGGQNPKAYDLNNDTLVNSSDRLAWLHDLKKTWVGDADLNGQFNSADFVVAFQAGKYEVPGAKATWVQGDWNGDQFFTSADFVAAFADGGYEAGPRPGAVSAVPEPGSLTLLLCGGLWLLRRRRA